MIKPGAEGLLAMALMSELNLRLGVQAPEFLVGAGERIGEACLPPEQTDIPALGLWMNQMWAELGMGQVLLTTGPRQLILRHRLPDLPKEAKLWRAALPPLVEGIYRAWLMQLDSLGQLTLGQVTEREIEFLYAD